MKAPPRDANRRGHDPRSDPLSTPDDIPHGYCQCGCGEPTSIAACTSALRGTRRGEPLRFRRGHWARVRPPIDLVTTFWDKVDVRGPDECWHWKAFCTPQGYGLAWDPKRKQMVNAHRVAYELTHGALPEKPAGLLGANGVIVRHSCDNPPCVNPAHLLSGSQQDNMDDKVARGRLPNVRGESNPKAKLTAAEIAAIRAGYTGKYGEKMAIARAYGISSGHVSKIIARDVW